MRIAASANQAIRIAASRPRLIFPFQVDFARVASISQWKREFTLETVLVELRR
jgi:hypothetical protein